MELQEAFAARRSIRKFQPRSVEGEKLRALVHAACMAPTASNLQAWRFLVVTDPALVRKITLFSPGLSGNPPAIIAVCSNLNEDRISAHAKESTCLIDASMAAENLMLQAVELELGTCAIKSYHEAAVRKMLHLPEHIRLEFLISVGYPEGQPRTPARKGDNVVLHYNVWEETE